jgi:hypothetical protein
MMKPVAVSRQHACTFIAGLFPIVPRMMAPSSTPKRISYPDQRGASDRHPIAVFDVIRILKVEISQPLDHGRALDYLRDRGLSIDMMRVVTRAAGERVQTSCIPHLFGRH